MHAHRSVNPAPARDPTAARVYAALDEVAARRRAAGQGPRRLLVVTDVGKDYDDLVALTLLAELQRRGLVHIAGVVANLAPAASRARLASGALRSLGCGRVPVACGSRGGPQDHGVAAYEFDGPLMAAPTPPWRGARALMREVLEQSRATNQRLTLVCLSSLTDVAALVTAHPTLVADAVADMHIQGGNRADGAARLRPDADAANNRFDLAAAACLHTFAQDQGVPTFTYTKAAAFAAKLPADLFARLADTGHPVGKTLDGVRVRQEQSFYRRACAADPAARFRPEFDQQWYLTHKTSWRAGRDGPMPAVADIGTYLTEVVVYDALAALGAAGDDVVKALGVFMPEIRWLAAANASRIPHALIGAGHGSAGTGVVAAPLRAALAALLLGALMATGPHAGPAQA